MNLNKWQTGFSLTHNSLLLTQPPTSPQSSSPIYGDHVREGVWVKIIFWLEVVPTVRKLAPHWSQLSGDTKSVWKQQNERPRSWVEYEYDVSLYSNSTQGREWDTPTNTTLVRNSFTSSLREKPLCSEYSIVFLESEIQPLWNFDTNLTTYLSHYIITTLYHGVKIFIPIPRTTSHESVTRQSVILSLCVTNRWTGSRVSKPPGHGSVTEIRTLPWLSTVSVEV